MKKQILLVLNGPASGSDETFNAVRLADELAAWTVEADEVVTF